MSWFDRGETINNGLVVGPPKVPFSAQPEHIGRHTSDTGEILASTATQAQVTAEFVEVTPAPPKIPSLFDPQLELF